MTWFWFIVKPDRELGPYNNSQMKQFAASGQLKSGDLVRADDQATPIEAGIVQAFFPEVQTAARPMTAPPTLRSARNQNQTPPSSVPLIQTTHAASGRSRTTLPPLPSERNTKSQDWYYAKGDQKKGPISSDQLRSLAKSGALKPTDLVWTEEMTDWKTASSVNGLIPPSQNGPPPLKARTPVKPQTPVTAHVDDSTGGFTESTPNQPWYRHWAFLTLTTLIFFPVTLVLVWWKSTYSKGAKWAWTGACGLMCLAFMTNGQAKRDGAVSGNSVVSREQSTTSAPAARGEMKVGDEFKLGNFKYKVLSTDRRSTVGNNEFVRSTASSGATFLVVSYTIENCSNESKTVMAEDFVLLDSSGRKFQPSSKASTALLAGDDHDFLFSQLQPGIPRSMKTAFEVPESAANSDMTLIIPEKGLFGHGEARVKITGR